MTASPGPRDGAQQHHPDPKRRAIAEGRRFLTMFLYLWVILALFALHERIVLRELGTSLPSQGFAFVNALVLAKVMLIGEDLDLGGWLRDRPLIYPILHESLMFAILFVAVHILEGIVVGWFHGETISASVPVIGGGGVAGLVCVAVIMFVSLIPFFAFRDLDRELGRDRLRELLFSRRGHPSANARSGDV